MAILHSSWALGLPVAACAASAADQSGRYRPSCRSAARADSVRLSRPKVACTSGVQAFYYIRHPRPFTAAATPGVMPPRNGAAMGGNYSAARTRTWRVFTFLTGADIDRVQSGGMVLYVLHNEF
jgi:hypothetical protein